MLHIWGILNFDVEIYFPHDSHSSPRGYLKQKSKESKQSHIMTSQSLLVEVIMLIHCLANFVAYMPFQKVSCGHSSEFNLHNPRLDIFLLVMLASILYLGIRDCSSHQVCGGHFCWSVCINLLSQLNCFGAIYV